MTISPEWIIGLILAWLLIAALLSPLEALGWWAGWFRGLDDTPPAEETLPPPAPIPAARRYVAYLTGVASAAEGVHLPREQRFLEALAARLPDTVLIGDIFPYSITHRALTGQRVFAWFWRYAFSRKTQGSPVGFLINLRNFFQVLVSADSRYGPIYNQGGASLIVNALRRHGYPFGSGTPVTLIGYSGGGQICLGAVPYLKAIIGAPVTLISLGGVLCSDPGVAEVERLYHIQGSRDWVQRIGAVVFPGRWPLLPNSTWNRARAQGRVQIIRPGPFKHTGKGGYLDAETRLPDGRTCLEATLDTVAGLIRQCPAPHRPSRRRRRRPRAGCRA